MKKSKVAAHWRDLVPPYSVGQNKFSYYDVPSKGFEWVDPTYCYPRKFDLVTIQIECGEIPGWWDGKKWDGLKLGQNDIVFYWRKRIDLQQY